jgi:hypothetical protein
MNSHFFIPKENQEQTILTQKPPAKKRGRKKKVPAVEPTNEDQQNVAPDKRKTVTPALGTTSKRNRTEVVDDNVIQEAAAVNTSINKLLEVSDSDNHSEGNLSV